VRDYEREVSKLAKWNPKSFFRHVNIKLKTRSRIADLKITDDQVINENMEKAYKFNEFFSSVNTREDLDGIPEVTRQEPIDDDEELQRWWIVGETKQEAELSQWGRASRGVSNTPGWLVHTLCKCTQGALHQTSCENSIYNSYKSCHLYIPHLH